ncbi:MAG: hypothetical protein AB2A00_16285 [Myxococcota bacterium]
MATREGRTFAALLVVMWACPAERDTALQPMTGRLEADPASVECGSVIVGNSAECHVVFRNEGPRSVRMLETDIDGDGAFSLASGAPGSLGAGERWLAVIRFSPLTVASHRAVLRVRSDADNDLVTVLMMGEGTDAPICDDANPCTMDTYVPSAGQCASAPIDAPCDDGNACTTEDWCAQGACVGFPIACDDGIDCTADLCDTALGCHAVGVDADCDDGDPCTVDACEDAGCITTRAPDGTLCGPIEGCRAYHVCDDGVCARLPLPAGVPCEDLLECSPLPDAEPNCGRDQCGNGALDSCTWEFYDEDGDREQRLLEERCDESFPAGVNCRSLGYSAGYLGCSAACSWDVSLCDSCPDDAAVVRCVRAPANARAAEQLAIAYDGEHVGVIWASVGGQAQFGLFDSDLRLLETHCLSSVAWLEPDMLARTSEGWLWVARSASTARLQRLTLDGQPIGEASSLAGRDFGFVQGSPDGPLLLFGNGVNHHAIQLNNMGQSLWEMSIDDDAYTGDDIDVVWTGTRYLAALARQDGLAVVSFADGMVMSELDPPLTSGARPILAMVGNAVLLRYRAMSVTGGASWNAEAKFSNVGTLLAGPTFLAYLDGTWTSDMSGGSSSFALRVAGGCTDEGCQYRDPVVEFLDLRTAGLPSPVVPLRSDPTPMRAHAIAAQGNSAVVAWISLGFGTGYPHQPYVDRSLHLVRLDAR